MKPITQTINAALAIAAFAFVLPSYAIVIPVGTTTADDLLINYDFSGATPAPPYSTINTDFNFSGFDADEIITMEYFKGLNGTDFGGSASYTGISGTFSLTLSFPSGTPDYLDGVYSVGFRLNQGAVDLDPNLSATGFDGSNATIQGSVVPEPASLALLGLGLAALAVSRRRKLN